MDADTKGHAKVSIFSEFSFKRALEINVADTSY